MSSDSTYCTNCDRNFVNRTAIEAHFRESSAHTGLWCQRCQRHFAQAAHRDQHVMDSDSHWSCHSYSQVDGLCHFDGCSQESLHKHWRETEHHKFCEECDLDYLTQAQLHQHDLEAHSISKQPPYVVLALRPPLTTRPQPKASNNQAHSHRITTPPATPSATPRATPSATPHAPPSAAAPARPAAPLPGSITLSSYLCLNCKVQCRSDKDLCDHWFSLHDPTSPHYVAQQKQPYAPSVITSEPKASLTPQVTQATKTELIRCEGTRHTPYEAVNFVDGDGNIYWFHSTSFQKQYETFSYEELRLADYKTSSNISASSTDFENPWISKNGCTKEDSPSDGHLKAASSSAALTNNQVPRTTCATGNRPPEASSGVSSLTAALTDVSIEESREIPHSEPAKALVRETEKPHIDCWASCSSSFPSLAAVLLHLESSACPGGTTTFDLHGAAANCEHWYEFIDGPYVRDLRLGRDLGAKYSNNAYPFVCPKQECEKVFQKLSSLFAHVESGTCKGGQEINEGVMKELKDALIYRVTNGLI